MTYEDKKTRLGPIPHGVTLQDRKHLTISGVEDVESFDEGAIVLTTALGDLIVRGSELHIEKLSLDGGDLLVEGLVESLTYEEPSRARGGLLSRLLRP